MDMSFATMRISDERWPKRILEWVPNRISRSGRPRKYVKRKNLERYGKKELTARRLEE